MKKQIKLILILGVLMLLVGQCYRSFKNEVTDVDKFTRYYESTDEESGGFEILSSNYITIEKNYIFSEESKNTDVDVEVVDGIKDPYEIPTFIVYSIKSGDALSKISSNHKIGLSILRANNPQLGRVLKVGDKIQIPTSNGIFYKVKSGDSVFKIAQRYKVKSDDIMKFNKLNNTNLKIGQNLYLHNPNLTSVASSSGRTSGSFRMPVSYKGVTSPFGRRMHPVLKRYIYHKGVDLRARYVSMYASKSGRVSYAGWMSGYGKLIIIKHSGGYETRYAHLNNIYVKVGQNVSQGALIGKTGMTGRVTGPHLHFEIRKNNNPLDPMKHLAR